MGQRGHRGMNAPGTYNGSLVFHAMVMDRSKLPFSARSRSRYALTPPVRRMGAHAKRFRLSRPVFTSRAVILHRRQPGQGIPLRSLAHKGAYENKHARSHFSARIAGGESHATHATASFSQKMRRTAVNDVRTNAPEIPGAFCHPCFAYPPPCAGACGPAAFTFPTPPVPHKPLSHLPLPQA